MPRLGGKGEQLIERPQQPQKSQQFTFRIAQRNHARNELPKYSGKHQTDYQRNKQRHSAGRKESQRDVSNQDDENDEEDLNRRRQREAEARSIFENLFQEGGVARVRVLFSFSRQSSKADIA